jgi:23S rRNA (cytosine1962-C5)-methyltransferase
MHADYELLDFGAGRKLERFGEAIVDRPAPAAEGVARSHPSLWHTATARYDRTRGEEGTWTPAGAIPKQWRVSFDVGGQGRAVDDKAPSPCPLPEGEGVEACSSGTAATLLTFLLQPSPFGHVGVFAEQADCWRWIVRQVGAARQRLGRPPQVLNLFAYTGGSTLAAAAAGADVVHIDSARNIVDRARQNAELSGLAGRPIRWITEDAVKLCRRELKRGNRYDAVVLDPPSYGHGPKGEVWKIGDDLLPLLRMCGELTAESRALVLVTCHSPGIGPAELAAYLADGVLGDCAQPPAAGELALRSADGRRLVSGVFARWP